MSAAVSDYRVAGARSCRGGRWENHEAGAKIPSGAEEVAIRLVPDTKLVECLRARDFRGPLVVFKYEGRESVVASARALRVRVGAAVAVANSLCHAVQTLVFADGHDEPFSDRASLLERLAEVIAGL